MVHLSKLNYRLFSFFAWLKLASEHPLLQSESTDLVQFYLQSLKLLLFFFFVVDWLSVLCVIVFVSLERRIRSGGVQIASMVQVKRRLLGLAKRSLAKSTIADFAIKIEHFAGTMF